VGTVGWGNDSKVDSIQFVVSAGTGGTGTIFIDDFRLEPMVPDSTPLPVPTISASSSMDGHPAEYAVDTSNTTYWESSGKSKTESLTIDRRQLRDLGGLTINWKGKAFATKYNVELSDNGHTWDTAYRVSESNGGTDNIFFLNLTRVMSDSTS